jgi:hypothetical protein
VYRPNELTCLILHRLSRREGLESRLQAEKAG